MNFKPRLTLSRVVASGTVALVLVAGPLLTGALDAQPPSPPPPPLPVLEQNLDANGFIRVHEQGTAQVNGTVTVNGGTVAVSNLPSALNVHQAPVAGALAWGFDLGDSTVTHVPFSVINATVIHVHMPDNGDKVRVDFQSPLSALNWFLVSNALLSFDLHNIPGGNFFETFPQPVPLSGMYVGCLNDQFQGGCRLLISIIGSSQ